MTYDGLIASLSARRAWIEITAQTARNTSIAVALRKESVDRNTTVLAVLLMFNVALRKESVDRNLVCGSNRTIDIIVALRKESVDRNNVQKVIGGISPCRSPQGERG